MFHSFFPKPRLFFLSFAIWSILCVLVWFFLAQDGWQGLSLGSLFGLHFPAELPEGADDAAKAAFAAASDLPASFWFYQYTLASYAIFCGFWLWFAPHGWGRWSVLGSAAIIFTTWYQVQLDVMINEWFGSFYDLIQRALANPKSITAEDYYGQLLTFARIALLYITIAVFSSFFISHYVFRWRTAMNNYYMSLWPKVRHIEGASQRVQEDTMRFATIMEGLGGSLIDSVMTLIAFLPILWALSVHVKGLPLIGDVPQPLVLVAILWSVLGTAILAITGIRLPGLQFRNQRVEAAYRKELVLGEDDPTRAQPLTVRELFNNVRSNYFRLYFNYLYFNVVRYAYLQASVPVAYLVLGPSILAGTLTLGVMQQIARAFDRVQSSFQYLVNSWTTIVELLSIYKRLKAFEAAINAQPLAPIEQEVFVAPQA